jgi:hypothetical protein
MRMRQAKTHRCRKRLVRLRSLAVRSSIRSDEVGHETLAGALHSLLFAAFRVMAREPVSTSSGEMRVTENALVSDTCADSA